MAHLHSVYDTDSHFSIDPITRSIRNESSKKVTVMQYDHNSERFTFEVPRFIEGHDMSDCNRVEVHYQNGDCEGVYEVDDLQLSPEDENVVICSWLLSQNCTRFASALDFRLTYKCVADNGSLDYVWSSAMYKGISVSKGICNSETVVEQHADVLEQWERTLFEGRLPAVTESHNNQIMQVVNGVWTAVPIDDSAVKTFVDEYISSALEGDY